MPAALPVCGERLRIVGGVCRFETKNFDKRTGGLVEPQPGVYHTRVVADKHGTGRQECGQLVEYMVGDGRAIIFEQLAGITNSERMLCDPLAGQGVVIIFYFNVARIHF